MLYIWSFTSKMAFIFGASLYPSIGKINARISTPNKSFKNIIIYVLEVDVPMVLGFYILDKEKIIVENIYNSM